MAIYSMNKLMAEARKLAADYRRMTGKTLPISGEIARHDAAELLGLKLVDGAGGYDALDEDELRVQIKGRVIFEGQKSSPRVGQLKVEKGWDAVVLVLMDEEYEPMEIYRLSHDDVKAAMDESSSSKRMSRGAMSVARFKIIGTQAWSRDSVMHQDPAPRLAASR